MDGANAIIELRDRLLRGRFSHAQSLQSLLQRTGLQGRLDRVSAAWGLTIRDGFGRTGTHEFWEEDFPDLRRTVGEGEETGQ